MGKVFEGRFRHGLRWVLLGLWGALGVAIPAVGELTGEVGAPRRNPLPLPADELGGSRQVWAVAQGSHGLLYFGTSSGVLEHDGEAWRRFPVPNQTTVRSLAVGDDGTVWVGAQGEMGWLARSPNGSTVYRSLLPEMAPESRDFADVWKTYWTPRGVLFQTSEGLWQWDGTTLPQWRPAQGFHFSYLIDDELLLLERGRGLVRWTADTRDGAELQVVAGGEVFADQRVYALLPDGDGGLLVATRDAGFFRLRDGVATQLVPELTDFWRQAQVYHGAVLGDGALAVATLSSGVMVIDGDTQVLRHLDRSAGLASDGVKFLYPGAAGGLWLGLDKGVDRLDLPSPWSSFGEAEGLDGVALDLVRHRGTLYAATNRGLLRLVPGGGVGRVGRRPHWVAVPGIERQAWTLLDLGDRLLVGGLDGVFELVGNTVRRVAEVRAANLKLSVTDPERVWGALFDGLVMLRRDGSTWRLERPWPDLQADLRTVEEDEGGGLWVWSKGRGLVLLPSPGGAPETSPTITLADGGSASELSWVERTTDGLRFIGSRGIYQADPGTARLVPLEIEGWPTGERQLDLPWLRSDARGQLWVAAGARLARVEREGTGWRYVEPALPGRDRDFVSVLLAEEDGVVWIAGSESLMRYDTHREQPGTEPPETLLRSVVATSVEGTVFEGALCQGVTATSLPAASSSIRFDFTAPALATQPTVFQTRMVGLESGWSSWREESTREFIRLGSGRYRFEVRARDPRGRIGPPTQCAFEVVPPWHQRWWVLTLFAVAFLTLGTLAIRHLLQRARLQSRRTMEHARRQEELTAARRLQQQLLPTTLPRLPHLEVAAHQETATEVGGDYYDFFPQGDGRLYVALGDATGHGLGAGLLVTATKAALLSLRQEGMRAAATEINVVLTQMGFDRRLNMVLGLMSLDPPEDDGRVGFSVSGGGLAPIYHLAAAGGVEEIILGGLPLGAIDGLELPEVRRSLAPDDVLVLMSDGLPELANPRGELLGYERLLTHLETVADRYRAGACQATAPELLRWILEETHGWAEGRSDREDDLTLMVLRIRRAQASDRESSAEVSGHPSRGKAKAEPDAIRA